MSTRPKSPWEPSRKAVGGTPHKHISYQDLKLHSQKQTNQVQTGLARYSPLNVAKI